MNVAFVHPRAPDAEGTGAAHSATLLVDLLGELGAEVTVYCRTPPSADAAGRYRCRTLDLDGFPYHSAARLNAELRGRAEELDAFDAVHSYLPRSLPAMAELGRCTSAATVVTLNAYGAVCPKNDLRYLDREPCRENGPLRCLRCCAATAGGPDGGGDRLHRLMGRVGNLLLIRRSPSPGRGAGVDRFHALSGHVRRAHAAFGYASDHIHVVPNILDERFLVERTGEFEPPWRLLYVGALEARKGVLLLPEVLERLARRDDLPPCRMTVVGEGGARDRLRAEAEDRGVGDRLELAGAVPHRDLPGVYAAHDLFLYPGLWDEPFGRVLLEALAAGTPVVGTDVGAVAEIVGDGGVVVDPSAGALAAAAAEALEPSRLAARSRAAREAARRFAPEAVAPALRRLYRGLDGGGEP